MRQVRGGRTPGGGWDLREAEVSEIMEASFGSGATPERPLYTKAQHALSGQTPLFMIICDEGWRSSIVCQFMYGWAADWLIDMLGRRPFAPDGSHSDAQAPAPAPGPA